jgi:hypothetical protein
MCTCEEKGMRWGGGVYVVVVVAEAAAKESFVRLPSSSKKSMEVLHS